TVVRACALGIGRTTLIDIVAGMIDEHRDGFIPGDPLRDRLPGSVEIVAADILEKSGALMSRKSLVVMGPDIDVVFGARVAQHADTEIVATSLREVARFITISASAVVKHGD